MSEARIETLCEQCGQTDDHPKVHIGNGRTVHHDCLSVSERELVVGSSPEALAVVEACEAGAKGADLLNVITKGA